ncbi:MAG: hypothetical protein K0S37_776 [Microbacterium sp.]|nr:hypothetical protein [Microbacterium sp.]
MTATIEEAVAHMQTQLDHEWVVDDTGVPIPARHLRALLGAVRTPSTNVTDAARAEALRRHPSNHTVDDPFGATGEAQSDPYGYEEYAQQAFIAGAEWAEGFRQAPIPVETVEPTARQLEAATAAAFNSFMTQGPTVLFREVALAALRAAAGVGRAS